MINFKRGFIEKLAQLTAPEQTEQPVQQPGSFMDKAKTFAKDKVVPTVQKGVDTAEQFWNDLPEETKADIGGFAAQKATQMAFNKAIGLAYPKFKLDDAVNNVNTFYNDIVLPTKQEFAGVPGKDYDDKYYTPDFMKDKANVAQKVMFGAPIYGYVSPLDVKNKINLNRPTMRQAIKKFPEMLESVLTHEGTHLQNRDAPFILNMATKTHGGVSDVEQKKLDEAYGFTPAMMGKMYGMAPHLGRIGKMEEATVNREYRKALYDKLKTQLGHNPTYDEFKEYVGNLTPQEVEQTYRDNVHNGYMDLHRQDHKKPLTPAQIEAMRRAWLEVARNNGSAGQYSGMA